ncbi:hypothetical protein [Metaclostridioides mangenotii]|uniref:hypothetical protein n=1 Tax=Metaclostridioides mangenotii TaxID=1540 RepID=UPI00046638B4|nr:hypothetical protein [Clostridioides mangenotii]
MYNKQTFENITERTLNSVDLPVYKGEGSFLFNMLEPTNTELAEVGKAKIANATAMGEKVKLLRCSSGMAEAVNTTLKKNKQS